MLLCLSCSLGALAQKTEWALYTSTGTVRAGQLGEKPGGAFVWQPSMDTLKLRISSTSRPVQWTHKVQLTDSLMQPLFEQACMNHSCYFSPDLLNQLATQHAEVRLYIEEHPSNPDIGIRSRRSLITTLVLKPGR